MSTIVCLVQCIRGGLALGKLGGLLHGRFLRRPAPLHPFLLVALGILVEHLGMKTGFQTGFSHHCLQADQVERLAALGRADVDCRTVTATAPWHGWQFWVHPGKSTKISKEKKTSLEPDEGNWP